MDAFLTIEVWKKVSSSEISGMTEGCSVSPAEAATGVPPPATYAEQFLCRPVQQTFSFYAPEYYSSNKCKDVDLNKPVLDKFVALLKLWEVLD